MNNWLHIPHGQRIRFSYENYRGETAVREVVFNAVQYGHNEWYPEPQWFLHCWDSSKEDHRSFALAKIDPTKIELLI